MFACDIDRQTRNEEGRLMTRSFVLSDKQDPLETICRPRNKENENLTRVFGGHVDMGTFSLRYAAVVCS
jgi:hypothetical protein